MNENTKQDMIEALECCLHLKSLRKLTVNDIANESGYTRQTFYNYFKDMYDFVFWVHCQFDEEALNHFYVHKSFYHCLCKSMASMRRHQLFYSEIIKLEGPNSFNELFKKLIIKRCYEVFSVELNAEEDFILHLYWDGAVIRICKWIEDGMIESDSWMAKCLFEAMPSKIKRFYNS